MRKILFLLVFLMSFVGYVFALPDIKADLYSSKLSYLIGEDIYLILKIYYSEEIKLLQYEELAFDELILKKSYTRTYKLKNKVNLTSMVFVLSGFTPGEYHLKIPPLRYMEGVKISQIVLPEIKINISDVKLDKEEMIIPASEYGYSISNDYCLNNWWLLFLLFVVLLVVIIAFNRKKETILVNNGKDIISTDIMLADCYKKIQNEFFSLKKRENLDFTIIDRIYMLLKEYFSIFLEMDLLSKTLREIKDILETNIADKEINIYVLDFFCEYEQIKFMPNEHKRISEDIVNQLEKVISSLERVKEQ